MPRHLAVRVKIGVTYGNNFSLNNLYNLVHMLIASNLIYIHFHHNILYKFFIITITLIITLRIVEVECFEISGPNRFFWPKQIIYFEKICIFKFIQRIM